MKKYHVVINKINHTVHLVTTKASIAKILGICVNTINRNKIKDHIDTPKYSIWLNISPTVSKKGFALTRTKNIYRVKWNKNAQTAKVKRKTYQGKSCLSINQHYIYEQKQRIKISSVEIYKGQKYYVVQSPTLWVHTSSHPIYNKNKRNPKAPLIITKQPLLRKTRC